MKSVIFAVAALAGLASASSFHERRVGHAQFHDLKRAAAAPTGAPAVNESCATTGCVSCTTIIKTWYGEAGLVAPPVPTTTSTSTSVAPVPTTTSTQAPPPPPATSAAAPPSPAPAAPSAAPPAKNQAASGYGSSGNGGSSSGSISTGGSLYAMSYTQYKSGNGGSRCASQQEVYADIASIAKKGFKTVRAYGTDCGGLANIADACKAAGLKMIVGIFVDKSGVNSGVVKEQIHDIKTHFNGDYSHVEMILLGNEVLFNNFATADALGQAISSLRTDLRSCGYNGPVSTADTVAELSSNQGAICQHLDVMAANIHPFFNDAVSAFNAGSFVANQMSILKGLCGGSKPAINSETGWPMNGQANGQAVPTVAEQLIAIESIKNAVGGQSVFFSFENDQWKGSGYLGVESHWGCGSVFPG